MAKENLKDLMFPRKKDSEKEVNWPLRLGLGLFFFIIFLLLLF